MADKPSISSNQPTVKVGDKEYVRIGDRLVATDANIVTEEVRHADGRVDVTVRVPCLEIVSTTKLPN